MVKVLHAAGHELVVVDDFSTGQQVPPEGVSLVTARIQDVLGWGSSVTDRGGFDLVYHLGSSVGVDRVMDRKWDCLENSLAGILEVCRWMKSQNPQGRLIYASTSEVYGDLVTDRMVERGITKFGEISAHRWSYAVAKACGEQLALSLWRECKIPVTVLRYFNIAGWGQRWEYGMVLPNMVRRALLRLPILVYGNGLQRRTFTDVGDAVRATMELALNEEAGMGEVYNIGAGEENETSMQALAELVWELVRGGAPSIQHVEPKEPRPDVARRLPDQSKLMRTLGWVPSTSLLDIVLSVFAYLAGKV